MDRAVHGLLGLDAARHQYLKLARVHASDGRLMCDLGQGVPVCGLTL